MRILAAPLTLLPALIILLGWAAASPARQDSQGIAFFEKKIRPLLAEKCYACHSAKASIAQGGLLLDSRAGWTRGGGRGSALVPGNPDASLLLKAVRYKGGAPPMPPAGRLPAEEIAALTEWVRMGAPDPRESGARAPKRIINLEKEGRHWAYQPLKRVQPPKIKNPIDAFILAKLQAKDLTLNPPAARRTLLRRATFDLIGLPPTPEEGEAFVKDRSPNAWEKVIDRLLASPHYGERWGRHWLDLARFAESHGYEQDYDRPNAYHYRDFVIQALNADMPYDQFVRWQVAGDEFAPEDPLALMATGFLAAGTHATQITKNQVEKERYDELDDMAAVSCTAFLGLTLGCARCHDHKYDPIPTRDYYRLVSTFTTTVRSDYDVNMDPEGYRRAKAAFDRDHAPFVEARRKYEEAQLIPRLREWVQKEAPRRERPVWQYLDIAEAKSQGGATLTPQDDGSVLASGKNPDNDTYTFTAQTLLRSVTALRLEALADPSLVKGGPGRAANGNFALSDFRVTASPIPEGKPVELKLRNPRAMFEQPGQLLRDSNGKDKRLGWAIDPQFGKDHAAVFELEKPLDFAGGANLTITLKFDHPNVGHSIGRLRLSVTTIPSSAPLDGLARPERVERLLAFLDTGARPMTDKDLPLLLNWYRTTDPEWRRLTRQEQEHLAKEPKPPIQKVLISSEGVPAVRTHTQGGDFLEHTHFLQRGDPNRKQETATQSFLTVLMRTPDGARRWQAAPPKGWRTSYQRRALANWLTDMERGAGPLLARVIVNRVWQRHMGRGIVATPSDFGTQGERPSHPELLDWLAVTFTEKGRKGEGEKGSNGSVSPSPLLPFSPSDFACAWSLKRLHRLIMTSATYQQSAALNPKAAKRDPTNRLCGRHPRQRLEAEALRDAMLAVSGTLDTTMFGPGTLDEGMKRRSIYFFVKRSRLIPTMMLFDAPNTLQSLPVRASTTIAPQALMLMNSSQVREYARSFARRLLSKKEISPAEAVRAGYRTALSRPPSAAEKADALAFLAQQTASYQAAGHADAQELALADFCQVLFGLNEFVYVE